MLDDPFAQWTIQQRYGIQTLTMHHIYVIYVYTVPTRLFYGPNNIIPSVTITQTHESSFLYFTLKM